MAEPQDRGPLAVYLHGFASGPDSTKATLFRERLAGLGAEVVAPDLNEGPGGFTGLTLSRSVAKIGAVLDAGGAATRGAIVLGSSLGGYLAALVAARDPRVRAAVLLAPAFDLPARWTTWLGEEGLAAWRRTGELSVEHYAYERRVPLAFHFYLDAMGHPPYPAPRCPVLVLHGIHDEQVPVGLSRRFAEICSARLVELEADHGMLAVTDRLWEETAAFLGPYLGR